MSRRRNAPPDSLELLLDTICNTFGGVLFLAILIAMLIQTSSKQSAAVTRDKTSNVPQVERLRDQLAEAIDQRQRLLESIGIQRRFVLDFATPDVQAGLSELSLLAEEQGRSLTAAQVKADELTLLETAIDQLDHQLQQLDADLAEAVRRRDSVRAEVKVQTARRTQTIRLPKLRPSGKREIGMIFRYGRLYVWHEYDQFGNRRGVNLTDMIVLEDENGAVEVAPKPFAGAPLTDQAAVIQRLRRFNPKTDYIAIIVYSDSYDAFADLKKAFVDAGYEYRLMPMVTGQPVADHGGVGGMVQ